MTHLTQDFACLLSAAACASAGAVWDVRTHRIPNHLTGSGLVFGLLLHLTFGGWRGLGLSAAAALIGGGIFFLFFVAGGMGAGDVKLMAAISAIAGLAHQAELMLSTVLMGGVFALSLALARGRMRSTLMNVGSLVAHHGAHGLTPHPDLNLEYPGTLRLPYGVAISAGCWITLLNHWALR